MSDAFWAVVGGIVGTAITAVAGVILKRTDTKIVARKDLETRVDELYTALDKLRDSHESLKMDYTACKIDNMKLGERVRVLEGQIASTSGGTKV